MRNRDLLERNPRIGMVYRTWDKMPPHNNKPSWTVGMRSLPTSNIFDMSTSRTLHWFRNDLRLDKPALAEARAGRSAARGGAGRPILVQDRWGYKTGPFRTRLCWKASPI